MCGRYEMNGSHAQIQDFFRQTGLPMPANAGEIFPAHTVPILMLAEGAIQVRPAHWGFPHWEKKSGRIINARSETAASLPMFRKALAERRCVIPSSGFFEWERTGSQAKYLLRRPQEDMLYMAGIADRFAADTGDYDAFVILTTAASTSVASIHDRMPVILKEEEIRGWLDGSLVSDILARPGPDLRLTNLSAQTRLPGW